MMDCYGFVFSPTDEELINDYLKPKMLGQDDQAITLIPEINLLNVEPWEIPGMALQASPDDEVWFFFCAPDKMNDQRENRKTKAGYWKITTKDHKILETGVRKTLTFYQGHSNRVKTNWVMHQYYGTFDFPTETVFTICKLKKKEDPEDMTDLRLEQGQPSASNYGGGFNNQSPSNSGNNPTQSDEQMQSHMQSLAGYQEMDYNLNSALQWKNNYYD